MKTYLPTTSLRRISQSHTRTQATHHPQANGLRTLPDKAVPASFHAIHPSPHRPSVPTHTRFACTLTLILSLILTFSSRASAADWRAWRGNDGLGISSESNLPTSWTKDKNIRWHQPLPGRGASSPIVVGSRVFVTSQSEDNSLYALAFDRTTGTLLWERQLGRENLPAHKLHNMATPTPVSDGQHLWVHFGTGLLACLDLNGKVLWKRNLVEEYGKIKTNHGYGSSPVLDDGRLFIVLMHQGPSYVLALDAATGKNLWKIDRNLNAREEANDSYSTPILVQHAGKKQLVLSGAEHVNAYDPATGQELWSVGGMTIDHPYGRTIAGLATDHSTIVAVASGFQNRGYTFALPTNLKGQLDEKARLWTTAKFAPDCPCPLIYQGNVYTIRDDGIASCLDLKTGQPHWQERVYSANVKVSPVAGDGKIYFVNGEGNCVVVKASTTFTPLATNVLSQTTLSTPAISNKHIFLRTENHLYCIGN